MFLHNIFILATVGIATLVHSPEFECDEVILESLCGGNCVWNDGVCEPGDGCDDTSDRLQCQTFGVSPTFMCAFNSDNKCGTAWATGGNCAAIDKTDADAGICGLIGDFCVDDPRLEDRCMVNCKAITDLSFPGVHEAVCQSAEEQGCVLEEDGKCDFHKGCAAYPEYLCTIISSEAEVKSCGWGQSTQSCNGVSPTDFLSEASCFGDQDDLPSTRRYWNNDTQECTSFQGCTGLDLWNCLYFTETAFCSVKHDGSCSSFKTCDDTHKDYCTPELLPDGAYYAECVVFDGSCTNNPDCTAYTRGNCRLGVAKGCIEDDNRDCMHSSDCGDYSAEYCYLANEHGNACVVDRTQTSCVPSEVCEDYPDEAACALIQQTNSDCYFDSVCKTFIDCESTAPSECENFLLDYRCHIDTQQSVCVEFETCETVYGRVCPYFEDFFCVVDGLECTVNTDCEAYNVAGDIYGDACTAAGAEGYGCIFQNQVCGYASECSLYGVDFCGVASEHRDTACVVNADGNGCVNSNVCEDYRTEASCTLISTTNRDCFYADGQCQTFSTCASTPSEFCHDYSLSHDCHLDASGDACVAFTSCVNVPESECGIFSHKLCISDGSVCKLDNDCGKYTTAGISVCMLAADFGCVWINGVCSHSANCNDYSQDYCGDARDHHDIGCTFNEDAWKCVTSNVCEDYRTRAACSSIKETNDECYFDGSNCLTFSACEALPGGECESFTSLHYCHLDESQTSCQSFTTCEAVPEAGCSGFSDIYCVTDDSDGCILDPICSHYTDAGFDACSIASEFGCVYELSECVFSRDCTDYSTEYCDDASSHHDIGCRVVDNKCVASEVCSDYKSEEGCDLIQKTNPDCYFLDNVCTEFSACSAITDTDICNSYIHFHECHIEADGTNCVAFSTCSNVAVETCNNFADENCVVENGECAFDEICTNLSTDISCNLAAEAGCLFKSGSCVYSDNCADYSTADMCENAGHHADIGCKYNQNKATCESSDVCESYKSLSGCLAIAQTNASCYFNGTCSTFPDDCASLESDQMCLMAHKFGCVYDADNLECVYSTECANYENEFCEDAGYFSDIGCTFNGQSGTCVTSEVCSDYKTIEGCYLIRSREPNCYFDDAFCTWFTSCGDLTVDGEDACQAASLFGCKYENVYDSEADTFVATCVYSDYCEDYHYRSCPEELIGSTCAIYDNKCGTLTTTQPVTAAAESSYSGFLFIVIIGFFTALL